MGRLWRGITSFFFVTAILCGSAIAQTSPGLVFGQVPTAAQWNSYFAAKVDYNGYTPLNPANVLGTLPIVAANVSGTVTISCPTCATGAAIPSGVQGDLLYFSGTNTLAVLNKSTTATRYLANTGTTNNPAWAQVSLTTGVTGTLPVANGGTGVTTFGGTNRVLYTTTTDNLSSITAANRGVLNTDASGVPSITRNPILGDGSAGAGSLSIADGGGANITIRIATTTSATYNFNLPLTVGTAGQPMLSGGGGSTSMTFGTVGAAAGGTGVANNAASTITISGAFALTATLTGTTAVTFPTSGTLATTAGGSIPSGVQGDILYFSGTNTLTVLNKSATATRYLANTGTTNNPAWAQVDLSNGVTGDLPFANLTQIAGLSVLGVTGASTADVAGIAGTANQILRINGAGTALAFGSIDLAQSAAVGSTILAGANGGLGFATAAVGDLIYASATTPTYAKLVIGSAGQVLRSTGTLPAWSTATYPGTVTANRLLYASATNVVSDLASANSSILVTDGSGVPSLSTTLPAHTLGGTVTGGSNQINGVIIGTTTPLAGSFTAIVGTSLAINGYSTLTFGTLADGDSGLTITGTMPTTITVARNAMNITVTSAGSSSFTNRALSITYAAGYTGSSLTGAVSFTNATAGTGSVLVQAAGANGITGNNAQQSTANGTTTGINVATNGSAANGNVNVGLAGSAQVAKNGALNIGVLGTAINTGTTPVHIGGYFVLNQTTNPTISAALVADNGAQTDPIFVALDNGTRAFSIFDGGGVNVGSSSTTPGAGILNVEASANIVTSLTVPLLIGGSGAAQALTYKTTTSGSGAGDYHVFVGGANGALEIFRAGTVTGSVGYIVKGYTSPVTTQGGAVTAAVQILGLGNATSSIANLAYVTNAQGPRYVLGKSKNATIGSHTLVVTGDLLGAVQFEGSDGTNFQMAAQIIARVDGTAAAGDMPGRIEFLTSPHTATPIVRFTIFQDGCGNWGSAASTCTAGANVLNVATGTASTSKTTGSVVIASTGGLGVGGAIFTDTLNIITPATDATHTDNTLCWDTTSGLVLKGSGALGICLGTSGRQFKSEFSPMLAGLAEVLRIPLFNYRYRSGYGDGGAAMQYGTTAQDMESILPDLVRYDAAGLALNYDYGALLFIGLRAIQELKADNDNLRAEVVLLRAAGAR